MIGWVVQANFLISAPLDARGADARATTRAVKTPPQFDASTSIANGAPLNARDGSALCVPCYG